MPIESDSNPNALKHLLGRDLLRQLGSAIAGKYAAFDQKRFRMIERKLLELELKPRVQLIRETLRELLPADYDDALNILLDSTRDRKITGFGLWPISDFVQTYGTERVDLSLEALKGLTPMFSSEFAVRPFLRLYPERTLEFLRQCATSPDVDLRRWASEGTRPRLPWGERLQAFVQDPEPTLKILEILKSDPELYVRKSVANHLNDIAKDHPRRVVDTLTRWNKTAGVEHAETVQWITHRALRTLIKQGDPHALECIGVKSGAAVEVSDIQLNRRRFKMSDRIEFEFTVRSKAAKPLKLVIDYVVHFMRANRKTSPKVFKLKTITIPRQGVVVISKHHALRPVTTRAHYPGEHRLEIQVNGRVLCGANWTLTMARGSR